LAFDENVDNLLKKFGIEDSTMIQAMMSLIRGTRGSFMRLIPRITELLNSQLGLSIDPELISAVFVLIIGPKIGVKKLANKFGVDVMLV
jgi:hypothetical protein